MKLKYDNLERNAIESELKQAEPELAALEKECAALKAEFNAHRDKGYSLGVPAGSRYSELLHLLPDLRAHVEMLRERQEQFSRADAYWLEVVESGAKAQVAREAAAAAEKQHTELVTQIARLRKRIEALQTESRNAEDQAAITEADASRAYAKALASGSAKGEKETLVELQRAQSEAIAAKTKVASCNNVIAALAAEAESLEQQAAAAKDEAERQRTAMLEQIMVSLRASWDDAADGLAAIGAKLAAVSARANRETGLHNLYIPVFAVGPLSWLNERDLLKTAAEISDADLTMAGVS
jgi:chromosome segregation ATPase